MGMRADNRLFVQLGLVKGVDGSLSTASIGIGDIARGSRRQSARLSRAGSQMSMDAISMPSNLNTSIGIGDFAPGSRRQSARLSRGLSYTSMSVISMPSNPAASSSTGNWSASASNSSSRSINAFQWISNFATHAFKRRSSLDQSNKLEWPPAGELYSFPDGSVFAWLTEDEILFCTSPYGKVCLHQWMRQHRISDRLLHQMGDEMLPV